MSEWKQAALGDLAEVQLGKMLDRKKNQGEYRRYLGNDNVQWNEFNLDGVKEMRFKESELERFRLKKNDLLVCEGGDPGRCALWEGEEELYYQKALNRVRVGEQLNARFLLYYMMYIGMTKEIRQYYTGGATIKHLPNAALKRVIVRYPSLRSQKKIAEILDAYDKLIENNRKQISLLEEAAQRLYKEWFVDLRFPGHEEAGFNDGLPHGWTAASISEYVQVVKGCSYSSAEIDVSNGVPMVNLASVAPWGGYKSFSERMYGGAYKADQLLDQNDVVMAMTEQTAGLAGYVARVPRYAAGAVPSMDLVCLRPMKGSKAYLYGAFRYGNVSRLLSPLANGTKIRHLKPEVFDYTKMLIPPAELQKRFESVVSPAFSTIDNFYEQIALLQRGRDQLLPKLMSGEVEVSQ